MASPVELRATDGRGDGRDAQNPENHDPSTSQMVMFPCGPSTPAVRNVVTTSFLQYPVLRQLATEIDGDTLRALAGSSRMIRASVFMSHRAVLGLTLRCQNEGAPVGTTIPYPNLGDEIDRQADKAAPCVRDVVAPCRSCNVNCAMEPAPTSDIIQRHRRICMICSEAPIAKVACRNNDVTLTRSAEILQSSVCDCEIEGRAWLCKPCSVTARDRDRDYLDLWNWRFYYNRKKHCADPDGEIRCALETRCLGARNIEPPVQSLSLSNVIKAVDLIMAGRALLQTTGVNLLPPRRPALPPVSEAGTVRVGRRVHQCCDRYGGVSRSFLCREVNGQIRSWCGWCSRIVPGGKEQLPTDGHLVPTPATVLHPASSA